MKKDPKTGLNDAEFLSHSTVRIEAELPEGYNSIGTGFLYQFLSSNKIGVPALVTNRHVLENALSLTLEFNPIGEDNKVDFKGRKLVFKITRFQNGWYKHPNPNIDLALDSESDNFTENINIAIEQLQNDSVTLEEYSNASLTAVSDLLGYCYCGRVKRLLHRTNYMN